MREIESLPVHALVVSRNLVVVLAYNDNRHLDD